MSFGSRLTLGFVLLGVVALASTSRFGGGGSVSSPAGYVLVAVAGLVVLCAFFAAGWVGGQVAFRGTSVRGKALVFMGMGAAVLAALFMIVVLPRLGSEGPWVPASGGRRCMNAFFFWLHFPDRRDELFSHPERFCWASGAGRGGGGGAGAPTELSALIAVVAGSAVVVLLAGAVMLAFVVRRSRRGVSVAVGKEDAAVLEAALDDSLDDLRQERDVRRAIVACYARMERALASSGRARRAHETPLEFLRRVLERVAHEPGLVLTELFERARFSVEPMGESDKRSAIDALEALRARVAR